MTVARIMWGWFLVPAYSVSAVCSVRVKLYKTPSDERRRHRREMQSPAIAFKIHIFVNWQFNLFLWQKQERNSQTKVMKVHVTILTPSHRISWLYYATMLLWWVDTLTILKKAPKGWMEWFIDNGCCRLYLSIHKSFIHPKSVIVRRLAYWRH